MQYYYTSCMPLCSAYNLFQQRGCTSQLRGYEGQDGFRTIDPEVISWQRHLISKWCPLYSAPTWEKCTLTNGKPAKRDERSTRDYTHLKCRDLQNKGIDSDGRVGWMKVFVKNKSGDLS